MRGQIIAPFFLLLCANPVFGAPPAQCGEYLAALAGRTFSDCVVDSPEGQQYFKNATVRRSRAPGKYELSFNKGFAIPLFSNHGETALNCSPSQLRFVTSDQAALRALGRVALDTQEHTFQMTVIAFSETEKTVVKVECYN